MASVNREERLDKPVLSEVEGMDVIEVEGWKFPKNLYYRREDHIWARVEGNLVRLGLDDFGQTAAGTIMYIKTFPPDREIRKDHTFGTLESGKYVGPMKAPVSGRVVEVNQEVLKKPSLINQSPYENWVMLVEPSHLEEDLKDLVHGDEIEEWLRAEIAEYRRKGWIKD